MNVRGGHKELAQLAVDRVLGEGEVRCGTVPGVGSFAWVQAGDRRVITVGPELDEDAALGAITTRCAQVVMVANRWLA